MYSPLSISATAVARFSAILRANALFCGASGLVIALAARTLAPIIGLSAPILVGLAVVLLLYAASLALVAARPPVDRRLVLLAAVLDSLWVIGSVAILLFGWLPFTPTGGWIIGIVAAIVDLLAVIQLYLWWQSRGQ